MQLQRWLGLCALTLLFQLVVAESEDNLCEYATSKLYVRDATQTLFPAGFLACVGDDGQVIPRCNPCECRDRQFAINNGKTVVWALCVENTESCVTSLTPDRQDCSNTKNSSSSSAVDDYQPGTVIGADTDSTAPVATTAVVEELDTNSGGYSSGSSDSSKFILIGCAVAGTAAVALFVTARKRGSQDNEKYADNDTSKAKVDTKTRKSYNLEYATRMTGDSILDADLDPIAMHHKHQQRHSVPRRYSTAANEGMMTAKQLKQMMARGSDPPQVMRRSDASSARGSMRDSGRFSASGSRISSFTASTNDLSFGPGSFSSALTESKHDFTETSRSDDLDFSTSRTNDYYSSTSTDDDYYGTSRSTGVSLLDSSSSSVFHTRDTEASAYMRDSDLRDSMDSVMFSNASLAAFKEEKSESDTESPRRSIEF